jgi:hypothetical protein
VKAFAHAALFPFPSLNGMRMPHAARRPFHARFTAGCAFMFANDGQH